MDIGEDRVIALVDMDCFYVQVEQRINPELKNKPCVVAQYKTWKGGGIIAVSYEARAHGVSRNMWADDARKLCPDLQVARVREAHGKADLTPYREASVEVIEVMSRFAVIERASIDEAYMDLTGSVQDRLKHMSVQDITPQQLKSTYTQGFPQTSTSDPSEDAAIDKGVWQQIPCYFHWKGSSVRAVCWCLCRGAAAPGPAAVAGASVLQRSVLACGAVLDGRRSDRGGDEGRCGGTHWIPLLRRHLAQQGISQTSMWFKQAQSPNSFATGIRSRTLQHPSHQENVSGSPVL
uniref:UmuC domain-containing protein n=1 Tax=Sinocyclocheilus anshuiensis TaxID=1608454 RepID=A0A671T9P6_9TELE